MTSLADIELALQSLEAGAAEHHSLEQIRHSVLMERAGNNPHLYPIVRNADLQRNDELVAKEELKAAILALVEYVDQAISSCKCSPFMKRELKEQRKQLKDISLNC